MVRPTWRQSVASGLNFEQASFHFRGAAQTPQNTREVQHKLALDSGLNIKVGGNG